MPTYSMLSDKPFEEIQNMQKHVFKSRKQMLLGKWKYTLLNLESRESGKSLVVIKELTRRLFSIGRELHKIQCVEREKEYKPVE